MAAVVAVVAALAGAPVAAHDRGGPAAPRVGVLIADHGEPPEYNADTYWSFREFFSHLIEMGFIPSWLTLVNGGTVLQDRGCHGCEQPRRDPELIDAWLRPHDGPAVFVPASDSLPAHYVALGGPGLREPDIYEHVGLIARHEWQLMGGRSPNYDQKLPKKRAVTRQLRSRFGADLPVRVGYGIDPRLGGAHQGLPEAVAALVNRDRVDTIVVAYHGVGFSDIMQTHMIRQRVSELVAQLDPGVKLVFADPMGVIDAYVRSVAADLFKRTRTAILRAVDRPGRTEVFQVYGDGGEGDDDPDEGASGSSPASDQPGGALWAQCDPCDRWFYVPFGTAEQMARSACPLCGAGAASFEVRLETSSFPVNVDDGRHRSVP